MTFIILPGYGGSGEDHWQTIWERSSPSMRRFQPTSWDKPDLDDWCEALDRAVAESEDPPVLIAHSLACLLVAHWNSRSDQAIRGAFLVAVPDPNSLAYPRADAASFADPPYHPLRFPSLIIASSNDPYGSVEWQEKCAAAWGGGFVDIGGYGHINASSGMGNWPEGRQLLDAFAASCG